MISLFRFLAVICLLAFGPFIGCGGGTSGSGLKTYEGKVSSDQGAALADVNVTIESTGDSAVTNSEGRFAIKSEASGPAVPFLIESPQFINRFTLNDIPSDSARIAMVIKVNTETDAVEVKHISIRAWFAGLCDRYFENRETIRQANQVPQGTTCSLNVEVLGDGMRLAHTPVVLEVAACEPGSPWRSVASAKTGSGRFAGSAEINFEFVDSAHFCRYRVKAETDAANGRFATYPIDTFSEQAYSAKE